MRRPQTRARCAVFVKGGELRVCAHALIRNFPSLWVHFSRVAVAMLPPNKQPWKGPVVRCGAAEEIGSRACLEDANLTVDDLAPGQGLDTPCAFYAVRER